LHARRKFEYQKEIKLFTKKLKNGNGNWSGHKAETAYHKQGF
jgi:hypothetical protein